jgi:hypothetical protein
MTAVQLFVVVTSIMAVPVWVMLRIQRSHRQMIERRREEWRAGGSVGPEPGRGGSGGNFTVNIGR